MAHAKQQIRAAVVTLVTGLATTGTRVHSTRVYTHESVPSLNVLASAEEADPVAQDGTQARMLEIVVEARALKVSGVDDQLDTIQAEVETALHADYRLGGVCVHCALSAVEDELISLAERPGIVRTMTFSCLYYINPTDPETLTN